MSELTVQEANEKHIFEVFGVAVNQIYADNDKRETGRKVRVLSVNLKPGKAACASCDAEGGHLGRTLWISLARLNSKAFTRIR